MKRFTKRGFLAFFGDSASDWLSAKRELVAEEIRSYSDEYLLNVNETEFVNFLVEKLTIVPIEFDTGAAYYTEEEMLVSGEMFGGGYFVERSNFYPRNVLTCHIPFSGSPDHLRRQPNTYTLSPPTIDVDGNEVTFRIIHFDQDAEGLNATASRIIEQLVSGSSYLGSQIRSFNASLEVAVRNCFEERKKELLAKRNLLSSLAIPVRRSRQTSPTFSVPLKRTPVIVRREKPAITKANFRPEPTLDSGIYEQILRITFDLGKQFERLPATYSGKAEEELRDHFLLFLEPNFEGSATGETFNRCGKTDILLRFEGSNVFVAELKFWSGEKAFLGAISQLLSYLTWRDSKAALILFVRNRELSSVLTTVRSSAEKHANFLGFEGEIERGWNKFRFHINDDRSREVQLAVQLFHIPPTT